MKITIDINKNHIPTQLSGLPKGWSITLSNQNEDEVIATDRNFILTKKQTTTMEKDGHRA
jgi:hypothetical protein